MVKNKNILSISNLKKSYDDFLALNNINLSLNSGEYVVLLGPNGAGKSTLFSILTGMLSPDLGDCVINGYSIKTQNVNALKAIGIVFQQSTIDMELSILENLNFHARLHGLNVDKLKHEIESELKANKLDNKSKNKVRTLSGGERRKVELIRSLLHNPKMLLMDEPTVGLDPSSRVDLLKKILSLKKTVDLSILWTTHLVDEAEKADKIIILNKGNIAAMGTRLEILRLANEKNLAKAFFKIVKGS